eukprot:2722620-Lingulodinium_polyedra.AAC.1
MDLDRANTEAPGPAGSGAMEAIIWLSTAQHGAAPARGATPPAHRHAGGHGARLQVRTVLRPTK